MAPPQTRPDLAEAITSRPEQFVEMLRAERSRNAAAEMAQAQLAAADEFDIDAQRRIEEAIRQEAVMENFGSAMEFNPESFGRVTMLYVETQVNGQPVKAFVDSGAQATIMSPECAERCGIMRLIDTRFAGIARGVGTAKILGRVHSAQIKLGDELFLPCSFTIMEGRTMELLFGLDMLKRHACVLDMAKNALIVHGKSIRFLDEHELPASARGEGEEEEDASNVSDPTTSQKVDSANANAAARAGAGQTFPGSGQTLNSAGAGQPNSGFTGMSWNHPSRSQASQSSVIGTSPSSATASSAPPTSKTWPLESIQALRDLGATEGQAKSFLDAAGGNVEVAASLLFQQ
jgi:DNA damage-inducible protein 1